MKFKYRARSDDSRILEGELEAESQGSALHALQQQGLIVMSLTPVSGAGSVSAASMGKTLSFFEKLQRIGTVPYKNKMVFFRQLATMIKAGLSLTMALDIIAEQEKSLIFRDVIEDIKSSIDRGVPLSQAMKAHSVFNTMMISLVQAGEEGGILDNALERVAMLLEKQAALKSKIRSAMFYPSFVVTFAIGVMVVFVAFILPKFQEVFEGMKIELPTMTLMMFRFGEFAEKNWVTILVATLVTVLLLIWSLKSKITKPYMDRLKLKLPIVKSLVLKSSMARSTQTLASLVSAGVPILRGLEMAEEVAGNSVIQKGFADIQVAAKGGQHLGDAARAAKIFPLLICQMMRIGEETGKLDEMLERVALWYDQELDEQIKAMTSLMEPVMIVIVGGIVGLIAMSIFGPITSAISQLG
ncbi:MAG: type II secretion system F family protein [Fretibacterium sp.]|nr:type II secretion system F family protein [Fretibacterium sp.]